MQRPKKGYILTLNKYKWNHLCIFRTLSNPFSTRLTSRGSRNLPLHQILPREPLKPLCSLNDYVIPPSPFAIPRETHRSLTHAITRCSPPPSVIRRTKRCEISRTQRGCISTAVASTTDVRRPFSSRHVFNHLVPVSFHSFPPRKVNRECGTDRER